MPVAELPAVEAQYERLYADSRYYLEGCLWIKTKEQQLIPFHLNPPQRRLYEVLRRQRDAGRPLRAIILKARQLGVSTLIQGLLFHAAATRPNVKGITAAHDLDSADALFGISRLFYDRLPEVIRPMTRWSNRREIVFENPNATARLHRPGLRSHLRTETASNLRAGRAETIHYVHASEVAYWPDAKEVLLSLSQAVPDHPDTMMILESTAAGIGGAFYEEYQRAKRGESGFEPIFIPWFENPEYSRPLDVPKRKFEETLTDEERRLRERHRLTLEQIAWRRWTIATKCGGDPEKALQEHPSDDVECFLVSGRPVFNPLVLRALLDACRDPVAVGTLRPEGSRVRLEANPKGFLKVWRQPEAGHHYVIGADVAEGLELGDYSCAQVLDRKDLALVASWHGHTDPDLFGEELARLGRYYRDAFVGCEVNNHGLTTCTTLRRLGYSRFYYRQQIESVGQKATDRIGWRTDLKTKPLMIDALAKALREGSAQIHDKATVEELLTYVTNADGTTSGQESCFDDRVIALAIALQMHQTAGLARFFPALG